GVSRAQRSTKRSGVVRCRPGTVTVRGGPGSAVHRHQRVYALSSTRYGAAPHLGHGYPYAFRPPRSPLSSFHPNALRAIKRPHDMTISMYKTSVPIFVQFLTSLSAVLDKAAAYAEAKKVEPAVLLNTRLAPDMFPLVRQVRAATDHAINACGRLAGADMPSFSNTETTIP